MPDQETRDEERERIRKIKRATAEGCLAAAMGLPLHTVAESGYAPRSYCGDAWEQGWEFINGSATWTSVVELRRTIKGVADELQRRSDEIMKHVEKRRADRAKQAAAAAPEGESCWNYIAAMIEQNVHHKTKGYGLGEMTWLDQLAHLHDEVNELKDAETSTEAVGEIADVLGVLIHMAICQGETPRSLADRLLAKLRERFDAPRMPTKQ